MYNKVEGYILNLIIFITGVSCMGKKKKTTHYSGIGGQAVLEGVMMKNKDDYAVAIRKPNGEIEVEVDVYRGILRDSALKKIPFIRGIFNFLDSMILGMKTINYSASFYEDEEAEETKLDKALNKVSGGRAEKILMGVTTVASIVIAIAVFMLLPYFLSTLLVQYIRNDSLLAIIEGIIRILIFFIRVQNPALRVVLRIALVPVIAGISYEIIRLAGRSDNIFVKIISTPGMWLQRLTTKEPDREMAEVAIRSVEAVFDWKSYLKDEFGYEVDDSWLQDEPGEEDE